MTLATITKGLTLFISVGLVMAASAASGDDWTLPRNNPFLNNSTTEQVDLPMSLAWRYHTLPFPSNPSQPAVEGNTVFFSSGDRIFALDTETGAGKWAYPADQPMSSQVKTSLAVYQGRVYFGANDGNLYCLNATTGLPVWAYATQAPIRSSPVIAGDRLYFGSDDNALHCVDPQTGEALWPGGFRTRDDVTSIAAVSGSLVYFLSRDTYLYAANSGTGRFRWRFRLPIPTLNVEPVIGDDTLYLAAGSSLYAMGATSGVRRWLLTLPAEASAPPAFGNQTLFVPLRNQELWAITPRGKSRWTGPANTVFTARSSPLVTNSEVIVGADKGVISAFDIETGTLKWRYVARPVPINGQKTANNNIVAPPVYANGSLYVLPDDGTLWAFRAGAPDNTPPGASGLTPIPGSPVSGSPPLKLSAVLEDEGSGIDEASIVFTLDGNPLEYEYDAATAQVTHTTPYTETQVPLANGQHEMKLIARDWAGNELQRTWTFKVDNALPRPRVRTRTETQPGATSTRTRGGPERTAEPNQQPSGMDAPPPPPPAPGPTFDGQDREDWRDRRGRGDDDDRRRDWR